MLAKKRALVIKQKRIKIMIIRKKLLSCVYLLP